MRARPGPFATAALAVASAVALTVVLGAAYLGFLDANVRWLSSLGGDLVVVEKGVPTSTALLNSARIRDTTVAAIRALPGVARVDPLYGMLVALDDDDRSALVYVVGLLTTDTFGGPLQIVAGHDRPDITEVVIDEVLAHDLGLGVGDTLRPRGVTLHVVGIATGGNAIIGTYAFAHAGAVAFAGASEPGHLFVTTAPGADVAALRRTIDAMPGVTVITRTEFLRRKQAPLRRLLLPVIGLVAVLVAIASAIIVGATVMALVGQRRPEYALARAVGATARQVRRQALWEATLATGTGLAAGLALGWIAARVLPRVEPRFVTVAPWWLLAAVATGAAAIVVAATVWPTAALRRLASAAPARTLGRIG